MRDKGRMGTGAKRGESAIRSAPVSGPLCFAPGSPFPALSSLFSRPVSLMLSLLHHPPPPPRSQRGAVVQIKLFCVLCGCMFSSPGSWYNHVKEHFQSPGQRVSSAVCSWISAFLKSQWDPFRATSLPATVRSYADCIVCRHFREVGHKVKTPSCRFQKGLGNLEDHLRAHLYYKSFYCLICSRSASEFADTVVDAPRSRTGPYFTIVPAVNALRTLKTSQRLIVKHIRATHLLVTTRIAGKNIVPLKSFVGTSPIAQLEALVKSTIQIHKRNLTAIRAVKKHNTDHEAVQQLRSQAVIQIPKIKMQPDKSYFTISPETDELLNDIEEVLANQNYAPNDRAAVSWPFSPSGSPASSFSFSSPSCQDSVSVTDSDVDYEPENQSQLSLLGSTPVRRRSTKRKHQSMPSYRSRSPPFSSIRYRPRPRLIAHNHRTRQTARQLSFDPEPGPARRLRGMRISDEVRNVTSFLESVNPNAPGVVDFVEEPEDMSFSIPYDREIQDRVDEIIHSYVSQTPEMKHLSGQSVLDVLLHLSDNGVN